MNKTFTLVTVSNVSGKQVTGQRNNNEINQTSRLIKNKLAIRL